MAPSDACSCKMACPHCGHAMELVPFTEWSLHNVYSVDLICPNCMHVERVEVVEAEREEDDAVPTNLE